MSMRCVECQGQSTTTNLNIKEIAILYCYTYMCKWLQMKVDHYMHILKQWLTKHIIHIYITAVHIGKTTGKLRKNPGLEACHKRLLERAFALNFHPNKSTIKQLGQQTGLSDERIRYWFTKARYNMKRILKKAAAPRGEYEWFLWTK